MLSVSRGVASLTDTVLLTWKAGWERRVPNSILGSQYVPVEGGSFLLTVRVVLFEQWLNTPFIYTPCFSVGVVSVKVMLCAHRYCLSPLFASNGRFAFCLF